MFFFIFNGIVFIKIILNFIKNINHYSNNNKNAIIYSSLYIMNDNPEYINLLIKDEENIISVTKIEMDNID